MVIGIGKDEINMSTRMFRWRDEEGNVFFVRDVDDNLTTNASESSLIKLALTLLGEKAAKIDLSFTYNIED